MPLSFITLYIELAALFVVGSYVVSSLDFQMSVPDSLSSEQAVHLSMQ